MKAFSVLAVLALAGCSEINSATGPSSPILTTAGRADMITNETAPFPFTSFNNCNGEPVNLSGTVHSKLEITTPSNGSFHYRLTDDYTLTGVGLETGAKYEGNIHLVDKEIINSGAATVVDVSASGHLIGQGKVPNMFGDIKTAYTINANGEITHSELTFRPRCQ